MLDMVGERLLHAKVYNAELAIFASTSYSHERYCSSGFSSGREPPGVVNMCEKLRQSLGNTIPQSSSYTYTGWCWHGKQRSELQGMATSITSHKI